MITDALMQDTANRAKKAIDTVPGVVGGLLFVRDPDGPGDADPEAVILTVKPDYAHAAGHLIGAVHADFARKPDDLGAQVREMLEEGVARWSEDVTSMVDDVIGQGSYLTETPASDAILAAMTPDNRAITILVRDTARAELPEVLRKVAEKQIEIIRKAWSLEAEITAESIATFMWDRALSNECEAGK